MSHLLWQWTHKNLMEYCCKYNTAQAIHSFLQSSTGAWCIQCAHTRLKYPMSWMKLTRMPCNTYTSCCNPSVADCTFDSTLLLHPMLFWVSCFLITLCNTSASKFHTPVPYTTLIHYTFIINLRELVMNFCHQCISCIQRQNCRMDFIPGPPLQSSSYVRSTDYYT